MTVLITIVSIAAILLALCVGMYWRILSQKAFVARSVSEISPTRFGELALINDNIVINNFSQKVFSIKDIKLIEAYTEIDYGLEESCCFDIVFFNGKEVLLDGSKQDQQDLLNRILENLGVECIDWANNRFPVFEEKQVLFSK